MSCETFLSLFVAAVVFFCLSTDELSATGLSGRLSNAGDSSLVDVSSLETLVEPLSISNSSKTLVPVVA